MLHKLHGKKIALTALLIIISALWVLFPVRIDILTPRLGIPVISHAGKQIRIVTKSSLPFYFPAIRWQLRADDDQYALREISSHTDFATKEFIVELPSTIQTGAYSLLAQFGEGRQIEHRKTVHIIDSVPENFSMIQLADLPTLGGDESGDRLLQQIISEVNIINPNVVLFTGDIAYGGSWDQYRRLVDAMATVDAPVIAVAGNHEYEGWAGYLHYFREPYHAVDYGRYKFISLNSGHSRDQLTESQFQWLLAQLRQLQDQTPIVQIHHPVHHTEGQRGYVHVKADELVTLFAKYDVPIVLSGHWHGDMVFDEHGNDRRDTWDFPGIPYVATTTAGADLREAYSASPLHHGYRLIRLKKDKLESYTYDYNGDGQRDAAASIPVGKLTVTQGKGNSLTVHNELNEYFPNAKIVITTRDVENQWQPSQGRIVRQQQRGGEKDFEILVDLPANSKTTITLQATMTEASQ
ncbi:metallophosphoesterase [Kaarinaea lacus]